MPMTPKEMISFLQKAGYVILSQNGSHVKMRNQDSGRTVVVPYHSKDLKKGLEQAILKQADLKWRLYMERLFYPAVFHKAEEGGFWVSFPDIPECMTQGDDMQDAYEMAVDALGLSLSTMEDAGEVIPEASPLDRVDAEDGTLIIVEFDMAEYRRRHSSKAVKKTLTIPEWLNEAAVRENINFSQVLQEALMKKLNGLQKQA